MTTYTPAFERILRQLATANDEGMAKHLAAAKTAANYQHDRKKTAVAALANEGQNCQSELYPYQVLKLLLDNITPEEFTQIIHRAAGHIPPAPEPKERPTNAQLADDIMKTLKQGRGTVWNGHKQ